MTFDARTSQRVLGATRYVEHIDQSRPVRARKRRISPSSAGIGSPLMFWQEESFLDDAQTTSVIDMDYGGTNDHGLMKIVGDYWYTTESPFVIDTTNDGDDGQITVSEAGYYRITSLTKFTLHTRPTSDGTINFAVGAVYKDDAADTSWSYTINGNAHQQSQWKLFDYAVAAAAGTVNGTTVYESIVELAVDNLINLQCNADTDSASGKYQCSSEGSIVFLGNEITQTS